MEELLITEPGPPKGAKPINGTASKSIAPPVGAKKKEDTVSEPDSNDGSTQAGLDVSQEPGPKGAQPSGKSGESDISFDPKESLIQKQDNAKIEPPSQLKNRSQVEELNKISTAFDEAGGMQPVASFNKAVVSGLAAIPKSVGILAKQLDDLTGAPSKPIEEYATYDLGKWIEDKALKLGITATDPTRNGFYDTQVPQALGSVASIILTGMGGLEAQAGKELMVNAPKGILGQIGKAGQFVKNPATVSGGLQMAVPEYEQALKRGRIIEQFPNAETFAGWAKGDATGFAVNGNPQSTKFLTEAAKTMSREELKDWYNSFESADEEAFMVFLKNYGVGQTEALPLAKAFNRINKITGGDLVEILKAGGKGGLEEASQEAIQNYFTNQIAKGSYDPERDPMMGMIDASKAGFFVGFVLPGLGAALKGASPETQVKVKQFVNNKLQEKAVDNVPNANPPAPAQVVSETRTEVKSTDDTQGAENAAEKILATTQTPNAIVEEPLKTDDKVNQDSQITPEEITGEPSVTQPESKSPEGQVQEGEVISQGTEADVSTVGTNYQKVNGNWQVKQADGSWTDIVTDTPNKTPEQQGTELTQMKDLLTQMEASEPQNLKMSPTEKGRIKQLEPQTERGAVRKFFWDEGKVLWRTQDPKSSIPRKGIAEEGGLSEDDKAPIKEYVDDEKGLSIDQIAEKIADQYPTLDESDVKTAVIKVLAQSDPKTWYAEQMETEDQEYLLGKPARDEEMSNLSGKIARLEAEEQGINETNKQLYENERRVDRGGESQSGSEADGQVRGEQKEEEGGGEPAVLIQQNGNRDKSQQALKELKTLNLTHVPGLGMGQQQAKGIFISTEEENRYEKGDKKAIPVTVAITNPYVADESYFGIQRAAIKQRFGKKKIEDLDFAELDLLSTMMTEYFSKENYDSIYFPKTETQEGELIVFNRNQVNPKDTAQENAIYESMQTPATLEFIDDKAFLETEKPMEYREKQKKIRKEISMLNKLIKCK